MAPWRADEIASLDADVQLIRDHPTSNTVQATAWLSARRGESRKLRAGLVETTAKARALAFAAVNEGWIVTFDAKLANGRDVDILLSGPDRSYYVECTVITESDEDQQVHGQWLEARKTNPDLLLARPGPFDSADAKGPSLYFDTNRFYIKVFDKLQKGGNPAPSARPARTARTSSFCPAFRSTAHRCGSRPDWRWLSTSCSPASRTWAP